MLFKDFREVVLGRRGGLNPIAKNLLNLIVILTIIASISITVHRYLTLRVDLEMFYISVTASLIVIVYSIKSIYRLLIHS